MTFYLPDSVTSIEGLAVHEIIAYCVEQGYIASDEYLVTLEHGFELIRVTDGRFVSNRFEYELR
jgi:hypothetical protein